MDDNQLDPKQQSSPSDPLTEELGAAVGATVGGAVTGVVASAVTGGTAGSLAGPIGTVVGALAGGVLGAVAGRKVAEQTQSTEAPATAIPTPDDFARHFDSVALRGYPGRPAG
jgi:phage tail tape-measure protein